ncbi:hypothetical protein JWS13_03945 (plasmid) [Rhodococcus pseudokoreensis]|uniref:Uncharacterized protein n=1 Tax=Rhodococcus pseudokoreensis TaxID=2811421 RepID=A0A974VY97_9NOCA|nr:hypothetical protein JWS13_03945 [Rhodococcus pseudokoreensis]
MRTGLLEKGGPDGIEFLGGRNEVNPGRSDGGGVLDARQHHQNRQDIIVDGLGRGTEPGRGVVLRVEVDTDGVAG